MIFSTKIINWYYKNKRELPWRQEVNPYCIWLSEIILQQTRVNQGLPYYLKFVKNYPTIQDLAKASEDKVLKDWQGLGYYTRARNLHAAAKTVVNNFGGEFPQNFKDILILEGVGPYTAAAISSIAFNLPYAAIDGNVQRVISRIFGIEAPINSTIGKKEIELVLDKIFDKKRPGDFNQAVMEFGALHCKPQQPLCTACPFELECHAYKNNLTDILPIKEKKVKIKPRYFLYIVAHRGNKEFIVKRTARDIWKNLYEFPLIELEEQLAFADKKTIHKILKTKRHLFEWSEHLEDYVILNISKEYKHVLTHQIIYARFISVRTDKNYKPANNWIEKPIDDNEEFAFPVLIQKYFNDRDKDM